MAGNLSDYAEQKILEHSTGKTAWTRPSVWIALYTAAPTDSSAGTEVLATVSSVASAYVRVKVADTGTGYSVWGSASSGMIKNNGTYNATSGGLSGSGTGTITFPTATANWGTITAVALVDAASSGNIIWYGTLTVSRTVQTGDTVSFAASDLVLSLD